MDTPKLPKGLKQLLLGSLGIHVLIVVVSIASLGFTRNDKPKNVVVTKLVRLGKKRPTICCLVYSRKNHQHRSKKHRRPKKARTQSKTG